MRLLEKFLKTEYDLPEKSEHLSIIDGIEIDIDFSKYQNKLREFFNSNKDNLTNIEIEILSNELSPYRNLMKLFTNYYSELLMQINGITLNYNEISAKSYDPFIDRLYNQKNKINNMHEIIVDTYQRLIQNNYEMHEKYDLKLFYTSEMIEKFIRNLDLDIPSKSLYSEKLPEEKKIKLEEIYELLSQASQKTKRYIREILELNIFSSTPSKFGLSNFDPELYMYYLTYTCGLKFKSTSEIEYLYKWAYQYLEFNMKQIKRIIKKTNPNIDTKDKLYRELVRIIISNQECNFRSESEIKGAYIESIDKYHKISIKNDFPITNKCELVIMNNPEIPVGFYSNNSFFLNVANWSKQKKYEVIALTTHETYPGHHLQIDISNNHSDNSYLARFYEEMFSTFTEGWALFAEKIHKDIDPYSEFGILDSDVLRIIRIIADIDIHYWGKSPSEVITKLNNILALDISLIEPEVNRYTIFPGQAVSYKIGESAFMGLYYKLRSDRNMKMDDPGMMKEYKKILLGGEIFLEELLNEHKIGLFYQ